MLSEYQKNIIDECAQEGYRRISPHYFKTITPELCCTISSTLNSVILEYERRGHFVPGSSRRFMFNVEQNEHDRSLLEITTTIDGIPNSETEEYEKKLEEIIVNGTQFNKIYLRDLDLSFVYSPYIPLQISNGFAGKNMKEESREFIDSFYERYSYPDE